MKHKRAFLFLTMALRSLAAPASHCRRPTYTREKVERIDLPSHAMVVFGDSFSDTGNIHHASNRSQPGRWSWEGRYADGPVWEEYVAQFLGLPPPTPSSTGGTNYAWGGATTDNDYIDAYSSYLNADVPSVAEQIATYLEDSLDGADSQALSDSLHVLFSGYNDYWWYVYRNYTTVRGQDLNFENVYTTVANGVVDNVERLYDAGARQFMVANVMNMSTWAEAELQTSQELDAYDVLVSGHNNLLSGLLAEFEESHDDATVYIFDVFDAFECLNDRRDYLGIQNIHSPCYTSDTEDHGNVFGHKFWDWYHPTTHAHQYASTSAIQSIYEKAEWNQQHLGNGSFDSGYIKSSLRKRRQK